jgi:DNA polymerase-3 subunit delta
MIVKPRAVSGFLERPDPAVRAVLVYGRDEGLVRERVEALMATVVDDLRDPFRVAELTADQLKNDPALLPDEAAAIAMTGGRRTVRVRNAGNAHAEIFGGFLEDLSADSGNDAQGDTLVVVEGGDLAKSSALRKVFERAANGAALPCYGDEGAGLEQVIVDHLRARHQLKVEPAALAYLAERLGADRALTRQELDKLALYKGAGGLEPVTLEDAQAAVGDSAAVAVDQIVFAAAGGDLATLDRALARYFTAGENPVPVLRALARHLERLHLVGSAADRGEPLDAAIKALRPPVFFKHVAAFTRHARLWPTGRLKTAQQITLDAEIDCKTTGLRAETVCGRALLRIATAARGRRPAA